MDFSEYPLFGTFDVAVVGGGIAGTAAAVAAARQGANVLLIEEKAYLGGTGSGAKIGLMSGFANNENDQNIKGLIGEVLKRMKERNGAGPLETFYMCNRKDLGVISCCYDSLVMREVFDDICREANVHVLFHTREIAVETDNRKIKDLVIHNLNGIQRVKAKTYIDASFHACVAYDAGCQTAYGNEKGILQPGTLVYYMDQVDGKLFDSLPQSERTSIAMKGISEGVLHVNNLLSRPIPNGVRQSNMSRVKVDVTDPYQWSEAEMEGRRQDREISKYFINHVQGFKTARMVSEGEFLGLRDSRRLVGKYVLTGEDVLSGKKFSDAIAVSSYPVDIHDTDGVSSQLFMPRKGYYYIPYQSLLPNEIDNLLVAGRCISATFEAHSALRVMATCFRIGEASGIASAYSSMNSLNVGEIDSIALSKDILAES